jgi:UDP-N-acetylglucosamine 4,6-dehydratase/5-epimerase
MLTNSTILITGGTGSFGREFINRTLAEYSPNKIVIFSRDEMKQWEMSKDFKGEGRLRFFIGDVRDKDRLYRACNGIDYIVHAAALKIVPTAEYNPFEYIKTNILGAMNVIDCALDCGVKKVIALSTDKASNPINLYGATKLCSDKLFVSGNVYSGNNHQTSFSVVRYGNVMGSRGSVIPFFSSIPAGQDIPITDDRMTRFMITLDQAVDLVFTAFRDSIGGEIFVPKIPSMRVVDIAKVVRPTSKLVHIGIRPGEKIHEQMIGKEDAKNTFEHENYYKIIPQIEMPYEFEAEKPYAKRCQDDFEYTSDKNSEWMTEKELSFWLKEEKNKVRTHRMPPIAMPDHSKIISSSLTLITQDETVDESNILRTVAKALELINSAKYQEALEIISTITSENHEVLFPKAIAHARLGCYYESLQVLITILKKEPQHTLARRLFSDVTKEIGTIT